MSVHAAHHAFFDGLVRRPVLLLTILFTSVVVGVSDPMVGEEVKAFVALRPGRSISADELIRHCRATLASYKVPRLVEFRDALPRNPTGKLLRRALRE